MSILLRPLLAAVVVAVGASVSAQKSPQAQTAPSCTHCGLPIQPQVLGIVTVKIGGKIYPVRCMLCARDLASQFRGAAVVNSPT
ncbi:MAG: hypothetical protein C4320_01255 [Armatimonadota bacterium]